MRTISMWPRIGLYFAETKFCGVVLVRVVIIIIMPPLHKNVFVSLFYWQLFLVTLKIEALQGSHKVGEVVRRSPLDRCRP